MRILVCPTEFKGTLPAARVARAMARGVRRARPDATVEILPLSDGGPGLLDALRAGSGGAGGAGGAARPDRTRLVRTPVEDPLGRRVEGRLLLLPNGADEGPAPASDRPDAARQAEPGGLPRTAAAESADACGIHLLAEEERRPARTGTEGVGDLVRAAASHGAGRLYLGLGGSATCDGGAGAARRLGWRFLDEAGAPLDRGGGSLERLARVEAPEPSPGRPSPPELTVLADVRNPLLGSRGAARTFGPQKGAGPEDVRRLEEGLARLAELSPRPEVGDRPGAGAAGGLAFGCAVFLGASIVPGAPWLLDRVAFDGRLERAEWVLTGEGAYDRTTAMGKVVDEVLRRARASGVPAALACGRLDGEPPAGVRAGDGGGEELDADGVATLAGELAAAA